MLCGNPCFKVGWRCSAAIFVRPTAGRLYKIICVSSVCLGGKFLWTDFRRPDILTATLRGMPAQKFTPFQRHIRAPASLALGGIIREQRELRGWSLGELARRSGLSRQGLFLTEAHQRGLLTDSVERIGWALGMAGSALLALAEERVARWPAGCRTCNNCCIEGGRLLWWNPLRGCTRPGR